MAVTIRKDENGNCHAVFDDIPDEQINKRRKFLKLHKSIDYNQTSLKLKKGVMKEGTMK